MWRYTRKMGNLKFDTIAKIALFTKKKVQIFREDISKKEEVLKELSIIFSEEAEAWKKVVEMGKFRKSFTRVLGSAGMEALRVLLCELDEKKYKSYHFGT
jgi:hypothetical protein